MKEYTKYDNKRKEKLKTRYKRLMREMKFVEGCVKIFDEREKFVVVNSK